MKQLLTAILFCVASLCGAQAQTSIQNLPTAQALSSLDLVIVDQLISPSRRRTGKVTLGDFGTFAGTQILASILSTANTWTALNTYSAGVTITGPISLNGTSASSMQLTKEVTSVPAAVGGNTHPVNLYHCIADNNAANDIECLVTLYAFGGSSVTGQRMGQESFLFNTAPTSASNTNRNYVAQYNEVYTAFGDGGTGAGDLRGSWFAGNDVVLLDTGAGTFNQSAVGREIDTLINAAAGANYVIGLNIVGSNATRGTTVDAALVIGGGNLGGFAHLGWKNLILVSDLNSGSPHVDPTYAGTTLFGTQWITNPSTPRAITDGFDLTGFTPSGCSFKSTGFCVNSAGGLTTGIISATGDITEIKSSNTPTGFSVTNNNAGASATAAFVGVTNAGQVALTISSTAGGPFVDYQSTIAGTTFFDATNAAGNFSFRTGAGPTAALNISAAGLLQVPLITTGTPVAAVCIDASNNIIKKIGTSC